MHSSYKNAVSKSTSSPVPWSEAMSRLKRSIGSTKISSLSILMDHSDFIMTVRSFFLNMNLSMLTPVIDSIILKTIL